MWITIFGCPKKIVSGNVSEFANNEFRALAQSMNIEVATTGFASPWYNSLCEHYNQVLGEMVYKIREEVDCPLFVAMAWATNRKNSLKTVHGFSPSQLVFGYNPILPSINVNKPPKLSTDSYSCIITSNIEAMKKARQAFQQAETSERVRRALNGNVHSKRVINFVTRDKVYYKKLDENCWRGPATIIGQDDQFVLVRHQSTWISVHPSRIQLIEEADCE